MVNFLPASGSKGGGVGVMPEKKEEEEPSCKEGGGKLEEEPSHSPVPPRVVEDATRGCLRD